MVQGFESAAIVAEAAPREIFFDTHRGELKELFSVLRHADDWSDDLSKAVAYTQANWVPGDHWKPDNAEAFTEQQRIEAREVSRYLGLVDAVTPPAGEYDQVIILGGMMRANLARTVFAVQQLDRHDVSLKTGAPIMFWGGPRPRDPFEDAWARQVETTIESSPDGVGQNTWWQRQRVLPFSGENSRLNDELAEGRAVLLAHLGDLTLAQMHLAITPADDTGSRPQNLITRYHLRQPQTERDVLLLNAPTVHRPQGEPRHTTESAARMWLSDAAPAEGSKVLFVTSNPYIARTSHVVREVLKRAGREDVQLEGCGPAAYDDARVQLFLGEIGRLLYEDQKLTDASAA